MTLDDLEARDAWLAALATEGKYPTPCLLNPRRTEAEARAERAANVTDMHAEISRPGGLR